MNTWLLTIFSLTLLYCEFNCESHSHKGDCKQEKCVAHLTFDNGTVKGEMTIEDMDGFMRLKGHFSGLEPGEHPFHIHLTGDLGNECLNALEIYNPLNEMLECPGSPYMIGHLHLLVAGKDGKAEILKDKWGQITHPYNINGRSVMIHETLHIEGPVVRNKTTGIPMNYPGKRIACAQINAKCKTVC